MINRSEFQVLDIPLTGHGIIEASAGTGKTYTITSLYIRSLIEKNLDPSSILVMTFTEDATAELIRRIRNRINELSEAFKKGERTGDPFIDQCLEKYNEEALNTLLKAAANFDEHSIYTIHGFCNRLLKEFGSFFPITGDYEILKDESDWIGKLADDLWKEWSSKAKEDNYYQMLLAYLDYTGINPDTVVRWMSEVLNKPYARLSDEYSSYEDFKELLTQLKDQFIQISSILDKEKETLFKVLDSGKLNKNRYSDNTVAYLKKHVVEWADGSLPFRFEPMNGMNYLGSTLQESVKTNESIPDLRITGIVDDYLHTLEELKKHKNALIHHVLITIKPVFKQLKRKRNLISYNDMVGYVSEVLSSKPKALLNMIRAEYPMALIDEFQDTDPLQFQIFRSIYSVEEFPEGCLYMIGDPKQAIYSFRGADVHTYIKAKKSVADRYRYTINNNFRSTDTYLRAINEFFNCHDNPFLIEGINYENVNHPGNFGQNKSFHSNQNARLDGIYYSLVGENESLNKNKAEKKCIEITVEQITELVGKDYFIDGSRVQQKDIAILVRNGRQGAALQKSLRAAGIKSVMKSRDSVFHTEEATEMYEILHSLMNLSYEPYLKTAISTRLLGCSMDDVLRFRENDNDWESIVNKLIQIRGIWDREGISSALNHLKRSFHIIENLASEPDSERRITNFLHICDLLASEASEATEGHEGIRLIKWLGQKISNETIENEEEEALRLESDSELIQISTMHSSKGLEYPIVFAPFLWIPPKMVTSNKIHTLTYYINDELYIDLNDSADKDTRSEHLKAHEKEQFADEVRLAYVTLSRAKFACFCTFANYNKISHSALSFILSADADISFEGLSKHLNDLEYVKNSKYVFNKTGSSKTPEEPISAQSSLLTNFRDDLMQFPRMLSYSSLSSSVPQDEDFKDFDNTEPLDSIRVPSEDIRFSFPKGANSGNLIHLIMEDINFNSFDPDKIDWNYYLKRFSIDAHWASSLKNWVCEILKHPLNEKGLSLSKLDSRNCLKEMEFYFRVGNEINNKFWRIIKGSGYPHVPQEGLRGYMKGFIDLTFKHDGRYYILDYKSNHLGFTAENYSFDELKNEIRHADYDLQYHIYTLAFHRFLSKYKPEYDYLEDFGGVFYLFIRGMESDKPGSGVFFDKPDFQTINEIDNILG